MADVVYDFIIVGGGVSGITFASTLTDKKYLVFEAGKMPDQRRRDDPFDALSGVSGAGLFSDGKFSFYPSAEKVYTIPNAQGAYSLLMKDLSGLLPGGVPEFPAELSETPTPNDTWFLKKYPSQYTTLEDRFALIARLMARIPEGSLITGTRVLNTESLPSGKFLVTTTRGSFITGAVVFAGGRYGPIEYPFAKVFRRFEFGVRVQTPSTNPVLQYSEQLDPKFRYIIPEPITGERGIECRTFCWCREGEVVKTVHPSLGGTITTFSGRADCDDSGFSNFGFNVILAQEKDYNQEDLDIVIRVRPFSMKMAEFKGGNPFGRLSGYLQGSLEKLLLRFPGLDTEDTVVYGPTIEGVSYYPANPPTGVYIIGDSSGVYRGIIAAMLSGYALALSLNTV